MTITDYAATSPISHLTREDIEEIGRRLDEVRQEVLDSRGASDAAYIRKVITTQRWLEMGSRAVLLGSMFPPAWIIGTAGLSVAKILASMEIGHNILHGQWDWMRDPKIHSSTWEWDNASTAESWKHSHNQVHHTYTNIIGKDNDLGYGIMRVDDGQRWYPMYLAQPVFNFINMLVFEYGIAAYDLELGRNLKVPKDQRSEEFKENVRKTLAKIRTQALRDYVVFPLLSGPSVVSTFTANLTANIVRNIWTHSVIMCGHFPEGVAAYEIAELPEQETRGDWYVRQMLGSANISGGPALHMMTGNLSYQIEHHLWPDLPSNRYAEVAPKVRAIFEEYALDYHSASLPQQVGSAWHKIIRLSLPNNWLATTTPKNLPSQLKVLYGMTRGSRSLRKKLQAKLDTAAAAKGARA